MVETIDRALYAVLRFNPAVAWHELRLRMRGGRALVVLAARASCAPARIRTPLRCDAPSAGRDLSPARRLRALTLGRDLLDSDLPLRVGFPVLISNITRWLGEARGAEGARLLRPGVTVRYAVAPYVRRVSVKLPGGETQRVEALEGGGRVGHCCSAGNGGGGGSIARGRGGGGAASIVRSARGIGTLRPHEHGTSRNSLSVRTW